MPTTIFTIANQKGGVGKTTTAVNLAAGLALKKIHTLLIDLDPQANATSSLGIEKQEGRSLYGALRGEGDALPLITPTAYEHLALIPSEEDLAAAEIELSQMENYLMKLRGVLAPVVASGGFRVIIIDCPPALGLLSMNSLAAADFLLITLQCEYMALEGLGQILRNVDRLKTAGVNPALELGGIVMTMFDIRTSLSRQVVDEVKKHMPDKIFASVIPRTVRLSEAPSFGKTIFAYDPLSPGSTAYRNLAGEVISRFSLTKYGQAFLIGLQSNLVYRWNFGVRSIFWFFQLLVVYILWGAAYRGHALIGGYSFPQTLTYFVIIFVLQFFIGAFNEDYQISEDIRNGLINQFLLKPINYFAYRLSVFAAARVVSGAFGVMALLIALPVFRGYLEMPHEAWRIFLGIPAMVLTAIIQFSIAYCFGLLAFWFLEIQGFVILSMAVETLLGGQIVPLDLLPPAVFNAVRFLPFFYQAYFPSAIFTGRQGLDFALQGLVIQAFWAVVLVGLAEFVWKRGLRHHTAAGG